MKIDQIGTLWVSFNTRNTDKYTHFIIYYESYSVFVFVLVMIMVGIGIGIKSLPDVEYDTRTAKEIVDEVFEKLINETILFE